MIDQLNLSLFRQRKTPVILQAEFAECAMVCVAMVAGFHDRPVRLADLRKRFGSTTRGATIRNIVEIGRFSGLVARPLKSTLEGLGEIALPAILHWNLNHFVVLEKVNKDRFTIIDPGSGRRTYALDEVSASYTGICVEFSRELEFTPSAPVENNSTPRVFLPLLFKVRGLLSSIAHLLVLGIVIQGAGLAMPFYMQWVIDDALVSGDQKLITVLAIAFSFALIFQVAVTTMRSWFTNILATELKFKWLANIFGHLLRLPLSYFSARSLGDVTSRFGAIEQIHHLITTSFVETLMDGFLVILILILMLQYSVPLTLIALFAVLLYAMFRRITQPILETAVREQILNSAKQQSHFLESVRGMQAIRLFHNVLDRRNVWMNLLASQFNQEIRIARINIAHQIANSTIFGLERICLVWLGANAVLRGEFSVGMLIAFIGYKELFSQRVSGLIDVLNDVRILRVQAERLFDITETPAEDVVGTGTVQHVTEPCLNIEGLTFQYSSTEQPVLKNLTLSIPFGQSICITGTSGCGKSTLVKLILTLLQPTQGDMLVSGNAIEAYGIDRYRELFGVVMQDDMLFAGSIAENIHFFNEDPDSVRVYEAATMAGVADDINAMPMGYRTMIGDLGSGLSGGQKQRILLARALYKQPKILVLDEATSHLDVVSELQVNSAVSKMEMTRIIVAHRPSTIDSAERVVVLDAGTIVSDTWRAKPNAEVTSNPRRSLDTEAD